MLMKKILGSLGAASLVSFGGCLKEPSFEEYVQVFPEGEIINKQNGSFPGIDDQRSFEIKDVALANFMYLFPFDSTSLVPLTENNTCIYFDLYFKDAYLHHIIDKEKDEVSRSIFKTRSGIERYDYCDPKWSSLQLQVQEQYEAFREVLLQPGW